MTCLCFHFHILENLFDRLEKYIFHFELYMFFVRLLYYATQHKLQCLFLHHKNYIQSQSQQKKLLISFVINSNNHIPKLLSTSNPSAGANMHAMGIFGYNTTLSKLLGLCKGPIQTTFWIYSQ